MGGRDRGRRVERPLRPLVTHIDKTHQAGAADEGNQHQSGVSRFGEITREFTDFTGIVVVTGSFPNARTIRTSG